ncbi:MAG TPA: DUF805 domain-containing protein [Pseudonocardia sp.]|nr:DUF805 domain-containing protein [Pseudonocardia sp.]
MQWYLKVLRQYADFTGRARRTEYWMFALFNIVIGIVLMVFDNLLGLTFANGFTNGVLGTLYSIAVLLPGLAVAVRRLHDTNRSGWWVLIALVPIVGVIVLIVLLATEGERGPNAYGPDPKVSLGYPGVA